MALHYTLSIYCIRSSSPIGSMLFHYLTPDVAQGYRAAPSLIQKALRILWGWPQATLLTFSFFGIRVDKPMTLRTDEPQFVREWYKRNPCVRDGDCKKSFQNSLDKAESEAPTKKRRWNLSEISDCLSPPAMASNSTQGFALNGNRDTISLIQGCLATLLLCSWNSLHLNVPAEDDTEWGVTQRRAKWMLTTIIAPEYVALHAIREWYEVGSLYSQVCSEIELQEKQIPQTAISAMQEEVEVLAQGAPFGSDVSDGNISSGNSLASKKSLDISEDGTAPTAPRMEQAPRTQKNRQHWTIKHAHYVSMGGFDLLFTEDDSTFRLNSLQFLLLFQKRLIELPDLSTREINLLSKSDVFAKSWACVQMFWLLTYLITRTVEHLPVTTLELFTIGEVCCTLVLYLVWWRKPKDIGTSRKIRTNLKRKEILGLLETEATNKSRDGKRVDILDHPVRKKTGMKVFTFAPLLPTFILGTCHLLGWNHFFVTKCERLLWRASSINCIVVPLAILGLGDVTRRLDFHKLDYGVVVLLAVYVSFRMYMCAEMFAGLRIVPSGVYEDRQWVRYIPHVGS